MRMQLRCLAILLLLSAGYCRAQDTAKTRRLGPIEADFILGYYQQDGEHSPVTGGRGTEELHDYSSKLMLNVPLDSVSKVQMNLHINHYTSASTDKINSIVSSASYDDRRVQVDGGYSHDWRKTHLSMSVNAGTSIESDYISVFAGANWSKASVDNNRSFSFGMKSYWDTWVVIFKEELRDIGPQYIHTDKRRTLDIEASYFQVLHKRLQGSVSLGMIYQTGLLSTPFQTVFYTDGKMGVELLPDTRFKIPIAFRLNYFAGNAVIFRMYYRFYWDSWDILANTASIEIPLKLHRTFSVYPFYRYHVQTAASYFAPYMMHETTAIFATSDYDLSGLHSHKFGMGIRFSPLYGNFEKNRSKPNHYARIRRIDLRGAYYMRSDGLRAGIITINLGFDL